MDEIIAACLSLANQSFEDFEGPIWILAKRYDAQIELDREKAEADFRSRVWLTYRSNFPELSEESGLTSDRGWGCMLRCGQMVLAEAIVRKQLGRDWRWSEDCQDPAYLQLISMFEDHRLAPFSLHVMTNVGLNVTKKKIGEWYGPNTVAQVIRHLPEFDVWNKFAIAVANSNILIKDEMRTQCKKSHPNAWDPLIIIVPLRLGLDSFNEVYNEPLKRCFKIPQCLGLLGGTPSHALFFIGYAGDSLIYLDPHTTQPSCKVGKKETKEEKAADRTYHCAMPRLMPFNELDPSLAVTFLCNEESEFEPLIHTLKAELHDGLPNPLFEVMDTRPDFMMDQEDYIKPMTVDELHRHKYEASVPVINSHEQDQTSVVHGDDVSEREDEDGFELL